MKKTFFLLAAFLPAALFSGTLSAQDSTAPRDLAASQRARSTTASANYTSPSALNDVAATSIHVRAIKDFKGRFAKSADEKWFRIEKGFCVYFTEDGFQTRAFYDPKGHWQASLKYADQFQLPPFIRDLVRRAYYDLDITLVNIIEVPEHKAYVVHLEDKKTLKILRVSEDGEMDVLHDYTKSN
jgi:hypothetical protein